MTFADLPLAEKRTAAWQELPWGCRFCGEPTGRRCVSKPSGVRTIPHADRLEDIRAFKAGQESRQAEVDGAEAVVEGLGGEVDDLMARIDEYMVKVGSLTTALEQTDAALTRMTAERDSLRIDLANATRETTGLTEQLATLTRNLEVTTTERNALKKRLDELTAEPTPTPTPTPTDVPAGYKVLRRFDLSRNEGWTLESGKPGNADGIDRPANVQFGKGPEGKSALLLVNREGSTVYTCDARGSFQPIPNYHRVRWVIEKDAMVSGMWPGLWARPLGGEGEIDHWEEFPANASKGWPVDAGTLHTTPYDGTHKQVQRKFPDMTKAGRYTIEFELAPGVARWWVNGVKVAEVTKAQFDTATSGRWDAMYGQASKNWYCRMTQQAGGVGGGPIPADLTSWRVFVHELTVFVPA